MLAERFADFLYRRRYVLFAAWWLHTCVIHYLLLGMMTWDGLGYRGVPIVELLQHGSIGAERFDDWPLQGHTPFLELIHLPFVALFGLPGFLIGFPLLVFPLCTAAVFRLVHELTGERRAATFGAFAYVAIPMVNQQPFTAYIDFAVVGLLAFFVHALLRLRAAEPLGRRCARLALATFLFSMARSQGVYVLVVLGPLLGYGFFAARTGWRLRLLVERRVLVVAGLTIAAACLPAVALQIYKAVTYGSPIAPTQFSFLGIESPRGMPLGEYFRFAGLGGSDLGSLATGFFEGWIWHADWPISAFYASRFMAAGLLFVLAVGLLPVFVRTATRAELAVVGAGVMVSLLSKDFAVPRWSYTTTLSIAVILGRALAELARARRGRPLFWAGVVILSLHLLRPELDLAQVQAGYITPRLNVTDSPYFVRDPRIPDLVRIYPDGPRYQIVVIEPSGFQLHMYGRRLRNRVLRTIPGAAVGPGCDGLTAFDLGDPHLVFVDDNHFTKDCPRTCAITFADASWYCGAWRVMPAR